MSKELLNKYLTEIDVQSAPLKEINAESFRLDKMTAKLEAQEYPNIHSVLIAKNGKVLYEKYFEGKDQIFGKPVGTVQHSESTLHDIRSITKSVVSMCVGIALDKGYLQGVDQKIIDFFPEHLELFKGEKSNWTIQHFLTMTTGMKWSEEVPYDKPENDEVQMTYSPDPIQYVLSKPLKSSPGKKFNYNGGTTQVLAEIVARTSNNHIDQFAKQHLFDPLGIVHFEWSKYSVWEGSDAFSAASGLRLTSRDLMKLGLLFRNKGSWDGQQIISANWVQESFQQRIEFPSAITKSKDAYGYQFWMWRDQIMGNPVRMIAARGNGGQNIYWDLKNDIIVVSTAGNYNNWKIKKNAYILLLNDVYPVVLNKKIIARNISSALKRQFLSNVNGN